MESSQLPVDQQSSKIQADSQQQVEVKKSIAETVFFCGHQGIALQGHRDDWKNLEDRPNSNPGNFVSLLQFEVASSDAILADHLKIGGANALYTNKTIQNELIGICGHIIRSTILFRIRTAGGLFSNG